MPCAAVTKTTSSSSWKISRLLMPRTEVVRNLERARCCSWEVKFKASMIQSSDSWEGHISTFLCYFLRLSGGAEAGHHYTWPPVSSRNRSKSSNYCWRPEPGLRLKTSAARSLRALHIEYVNVYDLSPRIQLNSHWRVDSVWELSISVCI